jgi:hypothetical protein
LKYVYIPRFNYTKYLTVEHYPCFSSQQRPLHPRYSRFIRHL